MEKIKKTILILIIAIILIILLIFVILRFSNKIFKGEEEPTITETLEKRDIEIVTNPTEYYTVVQCINKFLQYSCKEIPTGYSIEDQKEANLTDEERLKRVYDDLSIEYINDNNITLDNIQEYVNITENRLAFYPISMNMLASKSHEMISSYSAYGRVKDTGTGDFIGEIYIIVIIDNNNLTFAVKPINDENI